jgi:hypothetical protein
MSVMKEGLAGPKLATVCAALIQAALREDSAARAAERGSASELNAILAYVLRVRPDMAQSFLSWCRARTEITGATANGIHINARPVVASVDTRTLCVEVRAGWPELHG